MSGGISALKGFDYQATVILDRLLAHFDRYGDSAVVRPEGVDDLDLAWHSGNGTSHRRYEQIKKPREDKDGNRNQSPWTLQDAIDELFPQAISHLTGNTFQQVWIVGDEVHPDLQALVDAGEDAPIHFADSYWRVVHALARKRTLEAVSQQDGTRAKLLRWRTPRNVPSEPNQASAQVADEFCLLFEAGSPQLASNYRQELACIHNLLPSTLSRLQIHNLYGTEDEVTRRVSEKLTNKYALKPSIIELTLFRNLRGFINDIAKQPNRSFNKEEFEYELRCVWPLMLSIKDPPPLDISHVLRPNLTDHFVTKWEGTTVEAVGISGSGKTSLASEIIERTIQNEPLRLPLYVEIRPTDGLRHALAGAAFHLRRMGMPEPFSIAVEESATDPDVILRLARSFSMLSRDLLLLFDLVEGTCSEAFARDMAHFVRNLASTSCRIVILGQESALRELSSAESLTYGVSRKDIPGLRFEEFMRLVSRNHVAPDRARLWDIFQRVTAGRSAGLFAGLAQALARATSLDAMAGIASLPSEDMLPYAEQQRFARISPSARAAAESLVCFALPFTRADAQNIFVNENVGMAVREMLALGLLRANDKDTLEMHEVVRAGLEVMLAAETRNAAHSALASWYHHHGPLTAEVLHLQKSGQAQKARECARDSFLRGKNWSALAALVVEQQLVSSDEITTLLLGATRIDDVYLVPRLLVGLGLPGDIERLFQSLQSQKDRFLQDYQWSSAMMETILACAPERLHDVIKFVLTAAGEKRQIESLLASVRITMQRAGVNIDTSTVLNFANASPEIKELLLPFMMSECRRELLREAFNHIVSPLRPREDRQGPRFFTDTLRIESQNNVVEILAALPDVEMHAMLVSKSSLLGELAPLIWKQRAILRVHCIAIVGNPSIEAKVLESAIRVLIFLMEPSICVLCEILAEQSNDPKVRNLAVLVPSLVPALVDQFRYASRFLDPTVPFSVRVSALSILAACGADLDRLYSKMKEAEATPQGIRLWDFFFLQLCAQAPFEAAIPLLEEHLRSEASSQPAVFLAPLAKLGALPVPAAMTMLTQALNHANPAVRQVAAMSLGGRRSKAALDSLVACYRDEDSEILAVGLAASITASGPLSQAALAGGRVQTPAVELWQCILAKRLGSPDSGEHLAALATNETVNWQLRRAAISATASLPYEAALETVIPTVMKERSSFALDQHQSLAAHANLSPLLLTESQGLLRFFVQGRTRFVEFWGDILQTNQDQLLFQDGMPSGLDTAGWLYDRLAFHGWPQNKGAPDNVLNELHVPLLHSACLRALSRVGRPDIIEKLLPEAYGVWFAAKCLIECSRFRPRDPKLHERLEALLNQTPVSEDGFLKRLVADLGGAPPFVEIAPLPVPSMPKAEESESKVDILTYVGAVRILSGEVEGAQIDPKQARIFEPLTEDQFSHLSRLADPENDRYRSIEVYVPQVSFTREGHAVAQRRSTTTGNAGPSGALIRPALAASNRFGMVIPWHEDLLSGVFAASYIPQFLSCLDALDDSDRFYEEVFRHADILLPHLCKAAQTPFKRYLDARMVPLLSMYAFAGTDTFFECLCGLANAIDVPEIEPVLQSLLYRWAQRFDLHSPYVQHIDNYEIWRAFRLLTSHPRFITISEWQPQIAAVCNTKLAWYHKQDIARVLERDRRSYGQIECLLFKAEDWEHYHVDEIMRLDEAAERLFHETTD